MTKETPCPPGAIVVYEVYRLGTEHGSAYTKRKVELITDDEGEAKREADRITNGKIGRRFATLLPNGKYYLLASVSPRPIRLRHLHKPKDWGTVTISRPIQDFYEADDSMGVGRADCFACGANEPRSNFRHKPGCEVDTMERFMRGEATNGSTNPKEAEDDIDT